MISFRNASLKEKRAVTKCMNFIIGKNTRNMKGSEAFLCLFGKRHLLFTPSAKLKNYFYAFYRDSLT